MPSSTRLRMFALGSAFSLAALSACAAPAASVVIAPTSSGASHAPARSSSPAPGMSSGTPAPSSVSWASPLNAGCADVAPQKVPAGTWVTAGQWAFIPGLTITLPDEWVCHEQDLGEFRLTPADRPDDGLLFWKDVAAITSDGTTKLVPGVPRTVEGLTSYLKSNPDFVVSQEATREIAGGISARTFVVAVAPSARTKDKGCPVFPHCVDLLTDPEHWGPNGAYGIGAPEIVRLYFATIGHGADTHLFGIALDAPNAAELERFTKVAEPIIAGVTLPPVIGDQ